MNKTWLFVGVALLFAGSIIIYYTAYRGDETAFYGMSVVVFASGILLFKLRALAFPKEYTGSDNAVWWKQKTISGLIFLLFVTVLYLFTVIPSELSCKRANYILNHEPVITTIATVSSLIDEATRHGTNRIAYITYLTTSGYTYQKLDNGRHQYYFGQQIKIRYSVAHPLMFCIVPKIIVPIKDSIPTSFF